MKAHVIALTALLTTLWASGLAQPNNSRASTTVGSDKLGAITTLTDPERLELATQLQVSLEKFNSVVANLSPAQLAFRPKPNSWSLAECIEHVTLAELRFPGIVSETMQKPADPAFRRKIKTTDEAIRPQMTSRSWRAKSMEEFRPTGRFATSELAIHTLQRQRAKTMTYASQTTDDLRNHYWRHPLTGHIDLYQTLLLMSAHLERHTAQMERIKETEAFPKQ